MSGSTKRKETSGDVKDMGFFSYWYYRYLLSSALYMLEPWERNLFRILSSSTSSGLCPSLNLSLVFVIVFIELFGYLVELIVVVV